MACVFLPPCLCLVLSAHNHVSSRQHGVPSRRNLCWFQQNTIASKGVHGEHSSTGRRPCARSAPLVPQTLVANRSEIQQIRHNRSIWFRGILRPPENLTGEYSVRRLHSGQSHGKTYSSKTDFAHACVWFASPCSYGSRRRLV